MIDWQKLKRELQIFIAALLFALLLTGILLFIQQQTATDWQKSSNQLQQATQRFHTASDQKLILAQYQQRFQALKDHQVFGEEPRIDWVEAIQASSKRHAIPSVSFSLAQRSLTTLADDISGINVYVSSMKLDMTLLHEGDLYNLLADLDKYAQGLYGVTNCSFTQQTKQAANNGMSSLLGLCMLNWYTVGELIDIQYDENGEAITPEQPIETYNAGTE